MQKVALIKSFSKQYLSVKKTMRRHKKFFSSIKLLIATVLFLLVLGVYAKEINEGSTAGYFLKQEMKDLDQLLFQQHIVELDVLMLERELWREVNEINDAWYDHTDRLVIVDAGPE